MVANLVQIAAARVARVLLRARTDPSRLGLPAELERIVRKVISRIRMRRAMRNHRRKRDRVWSAALHRGWIEPYNPPFPTELTHFQYGQFRDMLRQDSE